MTVEVWILACAAAIVGAGVAGFFIGRARSSDQQQINRLKTDLENAEERLAAMDQGISEHFEESADLFGQLAQDYRKFYEHFATSAGKLGVSEDRREAMLAATRDRLLTDEREVEGEAESVDGAASAPEDQKTDDAAARVADVSLADQPEDAGAEAEKKAQTA